MGADDVAIVLGVAACIGLVWVTLRSRRRRTGAFPPAWLWVACAAGVVALVVGASVKVSGVVLAIPVALAGAWGLYRGGWRIGDAGVLLIALALGAGLATAVAGALDPNTGSYVDQSVLPLAALGVVCCVVAIVRDRVTR